MSRIAVLSNAASGTNSRQQQWLAQLDWIHDILHVRTESEQAVDAALTRLLDWSPDVLAINGGDGTLQQALTRLWQHPGWLALTARERPVLAALPGGTTNMSARDLGGGGGLPGALRRLLALRDQPPDRLTTLERAATRVRSDDGTVQVGMFFALGTIVRGAEYWQQSLVRARRAGEWSAGLALVRGAWGILRRHPPFADSTRVRMGSEQMPTQHVELLFLLATTMERLFLGIRPFWGQGPGPLAVTWVQDPPRRLLRRLPALLTGRGQQLPAWEGYHGQRPAALRLDFPDSWLLDGEIFPAATTLAIDATEPMRFLVLDRSH